MIAHLVRDCVIIQLIARYVRLYAVLGHEGAVWEEPEGDAIDSAYLSDRSNSCVNNLTYVLRFCPIATRACV